jgi:HEPN domain-containing protein
MNLKDIEEYWKISAEEDLEIVTVLMEKEKYVHAMFILHLSIEKFLKALYVNRNQSEAPYGHKLAILASKISAVDFNKSQMDLLAKVATFNLVARYDDYKRSFHQICNSEFAYKYYYQTKDLIVWIKSQFK